MTEKIPNDSPVASSETVKEVKSPELIAAELMVVGYIKLWPWYMYQGALIDALGVYPHEFAFLPDQVSFQGKTPVRAFVAQNWPKLNDYLNGPAPDAKKLRAAAQIIKLKWNGMRAKGSLCAAEYTTISNERRRINQIVQSNQISRDRFKAASGHDWKTCK